MCVCVRERESEWVCEWVCVWVIVCVSECVCECLCAILSLHKTSKISPIPVLPLELIQWCNKIAC